jgi:outer membrane lipoprotein-sorting protein
MQKIFKFTTGVLLASLCILAAPTPRASAADAPPAPAATQPLSQDSSVDQILDALDNLGQKFKDFTADVRSTDTDGVTGDSTTNIGNVLFQRTAAHDARVRVHFTQKDNGGPNLLPEDHTYTLDQGVAVERDYKLKKQITTQILKPGEHMDLMKLGGPFPLPIGQKKEDVQAIFDVTKIPAAKDDPPGTIHLQLKPKPDSQYSKQYQSVDIFVDLKTAMPRRIDTLDHNGTTQKSTELKNVKIDVGLGDQDFSEPKLPPGWVDVIE